LYGFFDVFLHFTGGVIAEAGMDMTIGRYINERGHTRGEDLEKKWEKAMRRGSGISFGKEVEDPIDIRSIADVTHLHVEIDKPFQISHLNRKSGAIGEVVDQGVDLA